MTASRRAAPQPISLQNDSLRPCSRLSPASKASCVSNSPKFPIGHPSVSSRGHRPIRLMVLRHSAPPNRFPLRPSPARTSHQLRADRRRGPVLSRIRRRLPTQPLHPKGQARLHPSRSPLSAALLRTPIGPTGPARRALRQAHVPRFRCPLPPCCQSFSPPPQASRSSSHSAAPGGQNHRGIALSLGTSAGRFADATAIRNPEDVQVEQPQTGAGMASGRP